MNIQFKKGVLELCVLAMLRKKDCYGYEIVNNMSSGIAISEGTIYPLLRRLKKDGYVDTYLKESNEGPPRKYYKLSKTGEAICSDLINQWNIFAVNVNEIIKEGE